MKQERRETSFSMTVACGPFTPDSDLQFKPWSALLKSLMTLKPDVVLLVGASCHVQARFTNVLPRWDRS